MILFDWILLAPIAFAAMQGYRHGFIREVLGLSGAVAAIWGAIRFSGVVGAWAGLGPGMEMAAFVITALIILVAIHLLARALTAAIDHAQLGLPNKVAGSLFGVLRKAFLLSILLHVALAARWEPLSTSLGSRCSGSLLCAPLRDLAPTVIPALRGSKWVRRAMDGLKDEVAQ